MSASPSGRLLLAMTDLLSAPVLNRNKNRFRQAVVAALSIPRQALALADYSQSEGPTPTLIRRTAERCFYSGFQPIPFFRNASSSFSLIYSSQRCGNCV